MKRLMTLLLALPLVGCVGPSMIPVDGAVERTIVRVLDRHDSYVQLDPQAAPGALAESALVRGYLDLPEVSGAVLKPALAPVLDRHDAYVRPDASLDELARSVYLGDSERLRSLLEAASPEPSR
jgi:hypothetical protein